MLYFFKYSIPRMTLSNVGFPLLSTRYLSCNSRGPSIDRPTKKLFSAKNSHHSALSSMPLVWKALSTCLPLAYSFCNATTFRKKSALWETISLRILDRFEKIRGLLDASRRRRAASNDHHFGWIRINRDAENHKKVLVSSEIDLFKIQPLISASSRAYRHWRK